MSQADGGPRAPASGPLVILCGAGAFPLEVAGEARRAGRDPFLVGVVGATDPAIEAYPHVWVRMGEVGKLFAALKGRAIAEMVIIGAMTRPEFADLRLDWGAVKRAAGEACARQTEGSTVPAVINRVDNVLRRRGCIDGYLGTSLANSRGERGGEEPAQLRCDSVNAVWDQTTVQPHASAAGAASVRAKSRIKLK